VSLEFKGTLEEKDWQLLVRLIKKGKCTPFVGAGACTGTLPLARDIANNWAKNTIIHYTTRAIDNYDVFPKECFRDEFENINCHSIVNVSRPDNCFRSL